MPSSDEKRRAPGPLRELHQHLPPERLALAEELRLGRRAMTASLQELAVKTYSSKASVSRWLSGQALPSLAQAERWAAVCGTDPERMRMLWHAAHDPGAANTVVTLDERASVAVPAQAAAVRRRVPPMVAVAGLVVTVLAAVVGDDTAARPARKPLSTFSCPAPHLRLPADSSGPFKIEVTPGCEPPAGRQRWIVVQLADIGHDRHDLYYLKWRIPYPSEPYAIESRPAQVNVRRSYYVVELTQLQHQRLLDSPRSHDGGLFRLDDALVVSNRAPNTNTGPSVLIDAVPAGRRAVTLSFEARRPPALGHAYWFVLEVHDVGGTHSEYYPRQELTETKAAFRLTIPAEADASRRRTGAVYQIPEQQSALMRLGRPDPINPEADFLLNQPCTCQVSDEIHLPFGT